VTQAERQSERVLLWLEWHSFNVSHGLAPPKFFLFAHYLDPHARAKQQTFLEKGLKPGDIRYQVARYDGAIRFADDNLGPVFEALRDRGWEDSTVVVFVSDHGEEFEDHGSTGHKNTLYDEQLRIPLIIVYPRRIEAGQRIEAPVSLLDIFPTLLDFVGVKISKRFQALIQGVSLVPYMRVRGFPRQATPEPARKIFAELHPVDFGAGWDFFSRAIRGGRFKLIRSYFKDGRVKKELYDLAEDPDEKLNVYEAKRGEKEIRELESRLSAFMREGAAYNPAFRSENRIKLDEGTQERLRALGYID
jgi:arylsulfatase A-like enzyme